MPLKIGSLLYSLPNSIYLLYLKSERFDGDIYIYFLIRHRFRSKVAVSSDHKIEVQEKLVTCRELLKAK